MSQMDCTDGCTWTTNTDCPMSLPGKQGCWCPILIWTNKEMFITNWQIYHIDQHTSSILCEYKKDGVSCHYKTDCEADMKAYMHKHQEPASSEKLATNRYVKENAWLDLTSSLSITNLERNCKTVPEAHSASLCILFILVTMDTAVEEPRTKANAFMVPLYNSHNWKIMRDLGVFNIKDMMAGEKESTPPKTSKAKKSSNRMQHQKLNEVYSTIVSDSKPLMPEIVKSGQTKFDEHYRAKFGSATDIQQSIVNHH